MDDWCEATLEGWTVAKLYVSDIKLSDAMSLGAAVAYGMDNVKDGEANFIEIDATFAYALDAQTEYSINAGYAMTDKMTAAEEKANCFAMYHGIKTKF